LKALNPHVKTEPLPLTVNEETASEVVKGVDVVIDGLDRLATRYAINKACVKYGIPYVYAGALSTYGNVSTIIPRKTACLECFTGEVNDEGHPTCETMGVLPPILSTIASIQVSEAVHPLLGRAPSLANKVLFIDIQSLNFMTLDLVRRETCKVCGTPSTEITPALVNSRVIELCGKDSFMAAPRHPLALNLVEVAHVLKDRFSIKLQSDFGLALVNSDGVTISLMKTGNALIKGVSEKQDAIELYNDLMTTISSTETLGK
jgi:adenylyltransferase/sulfurtransferase